MKQMLALILVLVAEAKASSPGPCDQAWSAKKSVEVLCRLEWGTGSEARGVEWVWVNSGCASEGETRGPGCAKVRECNPEQKDEGNYGIGVLIAGHKGTWCAGADSALQIRLLDQGADRGRGNLVCDKNGRPIEVRLIGPKSEKTCPFKLVKQLR